MLHKKKYKTLTKEISEFKGKAFCPSGYPAGSRVRSRGLGRGLGIGRGRGPIGRMRYEM